MPPLASFRILLPPSTPLHSRAHPSLSDNWGEKALRRRTEGTGRMRYMKDLPRRAKNNFRENTQAPARRIGTSKK